MDDYIRRSDALMICEERMRASDARARNGVQTIADALIYGCASGYAEMIKNIPAANVRENVRGEWVKETPQEITIWGGTKVIMYKEHCSNCGEKPTDKNWNFCPHCGADMRYRERRKEQ